MEWIQLPDEFKELLRLFHSNGVEYLVVGGYAVMFHGYPRSTSDIDIWVSTSPDNTERIAAALVQHGFSPTTVSPAHFRKPDQIIRIGVEPLRAEIFTTIPGVEFEECYARKIVHTVDGIAVSFLTLDDLRVSKQASGRLKDLNDLEHLQPPAPKQDRPGNP